MREWLSLDDDHFVHMVLVYVGASNVDRKLPSGLNIRFPLGTKTIAQREVVGMDGQSLHHLGNRSMDL